ncbi:CHAT domain-containing protein [Aggregatimonas sangjinii]|uniref:CHAT domain-containing protein n=2 Tax=Aggregatimonas sangjinii TaxID=2583587 RepID=A0A5B7SWL4_9FLAO|nr:CHAT domain-containing protein [Aggregatimonas sangjinii]
MSIQGLFMMRNCAILAVFLFCSSPYVRCQTSALEEEMTDYFWKGADVMYSKKDSAYFYLNKAEEIALSLNDPEAYLDILTYQLSASSYHFDLTTSAQTLAKTDSLLSLEGIKEKVADYRDYHNDYQINQGNYYYKLGIFETAKNYFLQSRQQYTSKPITSLTDDEATTLFSINNFLGSIYKRLGKYDISEKYYLNNRALIEQHPFLLKNKVAFLTNVNQLLAQVYVELEQPIKANALFKSGVEVYKKFYKRDKKFKNNLVNVYQHIAQNNMALDSLQMALKYIDESQDYLLPEDPFFKQSLLLYGDIYSAQGKERIALEQYQKALEIFKEYRHNKPHQDIAEVHGKLAEFYLKVNDYEQGLLAINDALRASGRVQNIENPEPDKVFSKRQLLRLLDVKAQLQHLGYQKTNDLVYLDAAMHSNKALLKTFAMLKKEFDSKLDKQFLSSSAYPIFRRMLATTYEAYRLKPSREIMELALNISEKNKDFLLLEALRNSSATQYGEIPKQLLDQEAQYRAQITHFEKQEFDDKDEDGVYSLKLFTLQQEYYNFLDSLKQNYPKYHNLKYGDVPINLTEIRRVLLKNNDVLISYTMSDKMLYAIVVGESGEEFLSLPFSEADREEVRRFYSLLSTASVNDNTGIIVEMGKTLFAKILKEPLSHLKSKNLVIIPDDVLHYLPFDLLQNENEYVLQQKNISYGNAVSSLLELHKMRNTGIREVLAFAPSFDGTLVENTERQFGKLIYNDDEVEGIGDFYKVGVFTDTSATLHNFMTKAAEYGMIHLATHASANDEFPDYSYMAFTAHSDKDNVLYIKDLYNTSLNADMVTLSACQTGIGKLQKGQGMMSLSKGFYYAGAKSLVNTLWKINDKSTVPLMAFFYEGLSEGKSKSEALRHAKLRYLETIDDDLLKHPYYWAAFTVSGNVAPLEDKTNKWWWLSLLPIIAFGAWLLKSKH